jgi:hypothetical protein
MMTNSDSPEKAVKDLASECRRLAPVNVKESIEHGPDLWMLGAPAAADEGLIGIATTSTQVLYVREQDVRDVRPSGGRYLFRIRSDASAFVREEHVVRLSPTAKCNCAEGDATVLNKPRKPKPKPPIIDCTPVCSIELECGPFSDPETGATIQLCWLVLRCVDPCEPGPLV